MDSPTFRSSSSRNSTGSPSFAVFELRSDTNFKETDVPSLRRHPALVLQVGLVGSDAAPSAVAVVRRTASTVPLGFLACADSIASITDLSTPAFFKSISAWGEVSKSVLLDSISFRIRLASKPYFVILTMSVFVSGLRVCPNDPVTAHRLSARNISKLRRFMCGTPKDFMFRKFDLKPNLTVSVD